MTIATLIENLTAIGQEHGYEVLVLVIDSEGPWPFTLGISEESWGPHQRKVLYIHTTWLEE